MCGSRRLETGATLSWSYIFLSLCSFPPNCAENLCFRGYPVFDGTPFSLGRRCSCKPSCNLGIFSLTCRRESSVQRAQDGAAGCTELAGGPVTCSHPRGQTPCSVRGEKRLKVGFPMEPCKENMFCPSPSSHSAWENQRLVI